MWCRWASAACAGAHYLIDLASAAVRNAWMNCIAHILVEPVGFWKQGTALFQFQFNTAIVNMQLFKYLSILTLLVLNACSDNGTSSAPASPPEHSTPPDNGQNPGQEE